MPKPWIRRSWRPGRRKAMLIGLLLCIGLWSGCGLSNKQLVPPPLLPDLTDQEILILGREAPTVLQKYLDYGEEVTQAWKKVQASQ